MMQAAALIDAYAAADAISAAGYKEAAKLTPPSWQLSLLSFHNARFKIEYRKAINANLK